MSKNRKKKKRIPVGEGMEVTQHDTVTPAGGIYDIPYEKISVVEWHPDLEAKLPAEEVHFVITVDEDMKLGLRFHSPDTLGFFIEELIARRKRVWPDAQPVDPDAELDEEAWLLQALKNMVRD